MKPCEKLTGEITHDDYSIWSHNLKSNCIYPEKCFGVKSTLIFGSIILKIHLLSFLVPTYIQLHVSDYFWLESCCRSVLLMWPWVTFACMNWHDTHFILLAFHQVCKKTKKKESERGDKRGQTDRQKDGFFCLPQFPSPLILWTYPLQKVKRSLRRSIVLFSDDGS